MKQLTKIAISNAFVELLQTRTIDKITVKDITEKCGINRQTFYYHFSDIYKLMEWTLDYEINIFEKAYCKNPKEWKQSLRYLFDYLRSKKHLFLNAYDFTNRIYYQQFLKRIIEPLIDELIRNNSLSNYVPEDKIEFLVHTFTRNIADHFLDWLEAGMPDHVKSELADYMVLMEGFVEDSLKYFIP